MRALVIYDSQFGNTRHVADAIGAALAERYEVQVQAVEDVGKEFANGLDLLVVGGPTHAHGWSETMRDFLRGIPDHSLAGLAAATFDTRYDKPRWLTGAASGRIAHKLRKLGCRLVTEPASFFVEHSEGPLEEGEIARATLWAQTIDAASPVPV